ncbi:MULTISPECIES: hypothetical protein [unclassified Treponema]|uniref:hypothetical protein n=1 Tax=unclassified Treponema TaxID=2638727 RepID=UPI0020A4049C|nr:MULTISPECIES: hypothetical protein [unclassified Treponema]UTC67962.1 hypothetical protein E4O06_04770 [Treponema sp. OMZ 789]UTC70688.1 hypothetical protein E4O01_04900 [Treponema sp. OMZ 790]UTC73406.1 hypothetical protein E4O02_05005 [Treponema sp. OMZ 791]
MFLKRKNNIFICALFCIFLIQIYSNDISEVKIADGTIIVQGKEFKFNSVLSKKDIEKKFGKPTFYKHTPGRFNIMYEDDGFIITLTNDGIFEHIGFDLEIFHKVDIKGLIIERNDTYSQIIKKIKNKKLEFTVMEPKKNDISIIVKFYNKNIGNTQLDIWLPDKKNGKILGLFYSYIKQ